MVEPEHSKRGRSHSDWEPFWDTEYFTAFLICDNKNCGEVVAVSGHASFVPSNYYEDNGEISETSWERFLKPTSMSPAPPIFPITNNLPKQVRRELKLAFQLFWTDLSTSTSRLRTSLERVLDDKGVEKTFINKKGEKRMHSLDFRIGIFQDQTGDMDTAESMSALRVFGNLGTHGSEVSFNDYFDLLDVYEDALVEIYSKKKENIKNKRASLLKAGGL